MTRFMSSMLSALFLSLGFTVINSPDSAGMLYFYGTFLRGFLILLMIYLFFGVPVSIYLDSWIWKYRAVYQIVIYGLAGALMGGIFLVLNPTNHYAAGMKLILMFGMASCLFSLFLLLLRLGIRNSKRA